MFKKKTFIQKLKGIFGLLKNEEFFSKLEEVLLEGDLGTKTTFSVLDAVKLEIKKNKLKNENDFLNLLKEFLSKDLLAINLEPSKNELSLYLFLGVNGVGKTTSIAKLGNYYKNKNYKVVFAAGDTFRAAGGTQLKIHGERLGIKTISQNEGSDPGAVIYDSISSALAKNDDLILADTAGRMHNRNDLMRQVEKINKIISKSKIEEKNYKKLLVLDGNTGQNAISQLEFFNKAIKIDAIVLSKFDSSSKSGMIISICRDFHIPIAFLGTGEKYPDIILFDKGVFLEKLINV